VHNKAQVTSLLHKTDITRSRQDSSSDYIL